MIEDLNAEAGAIAGRNANLSAEEFEGLRLLGVYTAGTFRLWQLTGSSKASCRAHLASVLRRQRIPQSQAGINRLRELYERVVRPVGDCQAARDAYFVAYAKARMSPAGAEDVRQPGA